MNELQKLLINLQKEQARHGSEIYNYVIPQAWNLFGFSKAKSLRKQLLLVNPYEFFYYTFSHMFYDEQGNMKKALPLEKGDWLKSASMYSVHIRSITAWDHDRDDSLETNLYGLKDTGTFLKAILLLPMYKRMGINTILLQQPFALGRTYSANDFAHKDCVMDFRMVAEELRDTMVPQMTAREQCSAYMNACHQLGIRVILEYCPGKMAVDNLYTKPHPEFFYWLKAECLTHYHAPSCHSLPQNTLPFTYTLKDFYRSTDVQEHIQKFVSHDAEDKVIAPAFSDQINANIDVNWDATYLRFYEDMHTHVPLSLRQREIPFITQDIIRSDLHPAKKPLQELWTMLIDNIYWYQDVFDIDGIYLARSYLLPEKLQKQMTKGAKKHKKDFVMIAEDTAHENSHAWQIKGFDMISGNSAYEETQIQNYKFHSFAYQLKGNDLPMFAASEFYDSRRCSSLEHGKTLTNLLSVMNHFLPNGIPMLTSGIETYEVQPMQLSEYGEPSYICSRGKEDIYYQKQCYIDRFAYDYTSKDLTPFLRLMEKAAIFRQEYIKEISDPNHHCIPVWFDSPKDSGIGFTYTKDHKALLIVCNTNVYARQVLHIHTENLMGELPFTIQKIMQIFSTHNPYTNEASFDAFRNIPLDFEAGEVKFLELT